MWAGVVMTLSGCNGVSGERHAEAEGMKDSVVVAEATAKPRRLPDTAYVSSERVRYVIERVDTVNDEQVNPLADLYADKSSVMTFRNGIRRQGVFAGRLDSVPTRMRVVWRFDTETERADTVFGPWGGGTGWTGQPLLIDWPDSLSRRLRDKWLVTDAFKGKEVIVGTLCGNVYFLNPDNGKMTREPIFAGNTIKGTVSFDPTFNGLLYVGHGTPSRRPFGAVTIDLFKNETVDVFKEDAKAYRHWGAFDSSPIRVGQFLFRPAENGSLYKFYVGEDGPKLHTVMRYKVNGMAPGIESSMSVYGNYGFITDNHGNVIGVNLDTMKPVWHHSLGDDTDASPMVVEEDGEAYVYVGCEIDRVARGHAVFAKLKAETGEEVWKIEPEGQRREEGKKHFDGGFYASPLLGQGDCEGLIFTNMVKNTNGSNGVFLAIDSKTGKTVYELPLRYYAWSSPVGFMTKGGKMIVATGDCSGNLYIIDAKKGEIIAREHIGSNFESSPAVRENFLIVGSRTNGIFKVVLE